jgi:hypothetical protein
VVTSTTVVPNLYVAHSNVSEYSAITSINSGNFYLMTGSATTGNVQISANSIFVANASNGAITATTFVGALSGAATTAGTVTTNAQPNITGVGSLTGLTVSNATGIVDFTTTANVTLGAVGNLHISGGTANYVLQTDGSGTLSWVAQSGGGGGGSNIANGNSNVSIATANGNITMSAVGNANIVVVTGTGANINGYANITGNVVLSGANVSLGNVSNLHITGGSNAQVLTTDGSGTLTWTTPGSTNLVVDAFTGNGVQTAYTLSVTPISTTYVFLAIGGVSQPRSTYSLTGNVVTISSAPPNGAAVEFTSLEGIGAGGGVSQIIAGTNVTISPAGGTGAVTINSSGGGGGGNTSTSAIFSIPNTLSTSTTLAANVNGLSVGPITVDTGVTVTVPSGQRWVIL